MAQRGRGVERRPSAESVIPDLRPTAGIRALACVGVLTGHVLYFVAQGHPDKTALYRAFKEKPWVNAGLHFAEPSMDVFMVLTGFLAAITLIPSLERAPQLGGAVRRYYVKRAWRILPAYYSTLAILHGLILPSASHGSTAREIWDGFFGPRASFDADVCKGQGWMNFAFMNNQLPNGGCFNISWSLAVQVHFYALLPLGLLLLRPSMPGFRRRIAVAAGCCIVAQLVARLIIAQTSGLWKIVPLPVFGPMTPEVARTWDILAIWSYLPLSARLGSLSMGVLTALSVSEERLRQQISRWRQQITAAMVLAAIPAFGGCFQYKIGAAHEPDHLLADRVLFSFAFTFVFGFLCPLVPSCLLALVCTGQPGLSRLLAQLLSVRGLSGLADVSYEVYLLHPLVIYGLYSGAPPSLWFNPERPFVFALMTFLVLGLSVAAATLLKGLLSVAVGALYSAANREPDTTKQESPKPSEAQVSGELIDMHVRAAEVHSPLSPMS